MNDLTTQLNILVVEDDAVVAQDLADCLHELGHCPVGPAYGIDAAKALFASQRIHIALLDIHLENPDDGIALSAWIKENHGIPVVFLTAYSDYATLSEAKKVYPAHFLVKPFNKPQLKAALEITANNFYNADPSQRAAAKAMRLDQQLGNVLTKREIEILALVYLGFSNHQLAERLCISANTVKTHMKSIFTKTGSTSRPDLFGKCSQF